MKKVILSAAQLIEYNANARGNNSKDCVARGLSLAFNIDYDTILKKLRSTAKESHRSSYKTTDNITHVIHDLSPNNPNQKFKNDYPTVESFAESNSSGTFVILCGKHPDGISSHLVTMIDGKLYDSWDSRNYYVSSYWHITGASHEFNLNIEENEEVLRDQMIRDVDLFGSKFCEKYGINPSEVQLEANWFHANILTVKIEWVSSKTKKIYDFSFNLSYNLKWTLEQALKYTTNTVKTRLYDRFYTAAKKDKEVQEAAQFFKESGYESNDLWVFGNEKRFYNSLPEKIKPFVTYLDIQNPGQFSDSVTVKIKALPGDPRKDEDPKVYFRYYDTSTVRDMIDRYMKTWERPEDDYNPYEEY